MAQFIVAIGDARSVSWAMPLWHLAKSSSHTIEAIVMVQFIVAIGDATNMEDDPCHLLWIHTAIPFLDVLITGPVSD